MTASETLLGLLRTAGQANYGEADVTQLEHALQCAEREGAASAPIVGGLLHDIGHLANPEDYPATLRDEDARHEETGAVLLGQWFGPEIAEPVRLHVPAKRYLAMAEPGYAARLSPASANSLRLQGGPFTAAKAEQFLALPYAEAAIRLRRSHGGLEHFARFLMASLAPRQPATAS